MTWYLISLSDHDELGNSSGSRIARRRFLNVPGHAKRRKRGCRQSLREPICRCLPAPFSAARKLVQMLFPKAQSWSKNTRKISRAQAEVVHSKKYRNKI